MFSDFQTMKANSTEILSSFYILVNCWIQLDQTFEGIVENSIFILNVV